MYNGLALSLRAPVQDCLGVIARPKECTRLTGSSGCDATSLDGRCGPKEPVHRSDQDLTRDGRKPFDAFLRGLVRNVCGGLGAVACRVGVRSCGGFRGADAVCGCVSPTQQIGHGSAAVSRAVDGLGSAKGLAPERSSRVLEARARSTDDVGDRNPESAYMQRTLKSTHECNHSMYCTTMFSPPHGSWCTLYYL